MYDFALYYPDGYYTKFTARISNLEELMQPLTYNAAELKVQLTDVELVEQGNIYTCNSADECNQVSV